MPDDEEKDVFLSIRVSAALRERYRIIAKRNNRTIAGEVREAMEDHADQEEAKA